MINSNDLLKLLSVGFVKYTNKNVKTTFKLDGVFKNGNKKYMAVIKNLSDEIIFKGPACLTKDNIPLFDDSALYNLAIEFEE